MEVARCICFGMEFHSRISAQVLRGGLCFSESKRVFSLNARKENIYTLAKLQEGQESFLAYFLNEPLIFCSDQKFNGF